MAPSPGAPPLQAPGDGGLAHCAERKENSTVHGRGTSAGGGGQKALCWENRKRGFPGLAGPPAGHPPRLPQILGSPCQPPAACLSTRVFRRPSDCEAQAQRGGPRDGGRLASALLRGPGHTGTGAREAAGGTRLRAGAGAWQAGPGLWAPPPWSHRPARTASERAHVWVGASGHNQGRPEGGQGRAVPAGVGGGMGHEAGPLPAQEPGEVLGQGPRPRCPGQQPAHGPYTAHWLDPPHVGRCTRVWSHTPELTRTSRHTCAVTQPTDGRAGTSRQHGHAGPTCRAPAAAPPPPSLTSAGGGWGWEADKALSAQPLPRCGRWPWLACVATLPGAAAECHRVPGAGRSGTSTVVGDAPPPPRAPLTPSGPHLLVPRWAPVAQSRLPCDLGPLGRVQDGLGRTSRDSEEERKSGAQEAGQALGPWSLAGAFHLCGLQPLPLCLLPSPVHTASRVTGDGQDGVLSTASTTVTRQLGSV